MANSVSQSTQHPLSYPAVRRTWELEFWFWLVEENTLVQKQDWHQDGLDLRITSPPSVEPHYLSVTNLISHSFYAHSIYLSPLSLSHSITPLSVCVFVSLSPPFSLFLSPTFSIFLPPSLTSLRLSPPLSPLSFSLAFPRSRDFSYLPSLSFSLSFSLTSHPSRLPSFFHSPSLSPAGVSFHNITSESTALITLSTRQSVKHGRDWQAGSTHTPFIFGTYTPQPLCKHTHFSHMHRHTPSVYNIL